MTSSPRSTNEPRIVVVMPAYNASRTLEKTYGDLPKDDIYEVILVDDVSSDSTVDIARYLGIKCLVHQQNRGYGGNQKTCYHEALADGADIVVMLHPDNQYDATRVPDLVALIRDGEADMVLGSRLMQGRAATLSGGMPLYKYVSNRFLTMIENLAFGTNLTEMHTGYRAYSRNLLETIPFHRNSDDFVFDSQVIAQAVAFGFRIAEVPVPTRYFPEASSVNFRRSLTYGLSTLGVAATYLLHKLGLRRSDLFTLATAELPDASSQIK